MAPRTIIAATLVLTLAGTVPAADPKESEAVKRAIKGGQSYLKAVFKPGGPGPGGFGPGGLVPPGLLDPLQGAGGPGTGSAALAGLALIESGVPANDPVVALLAKNTRESVMGATGTYTISLFIMFLDRVGSKSDEPLIQFLTLRLLTGQCGDGSWSYQCNGLTLDPVQQKSLWADLSRGAKMTTPDAPKPKKKETRPREDLDENPKPAKKDEPPPPPAPKEKEEEKPSSGLHPSLEKFRNLPASPGSYGFGRPGTGDHSNTQFATVALWCGRRHHVPVADALAGLDKHYRQGPNEDGGWAYTGSGGGSTPSMTCAGLMGLAMGFGTKNLKDGSDKDARVDAETISNDPVVKGGLKYLGDFLVDAEGGRAAGVLERDIGSDLYFMWSLERVGMVYGLTTIGKVDWYDWGSKILVKSQNPRDGSWSGEWVHSGNAENSTAFALLFLCRANLAEDISAKMKGSVKDPGTNKLRGGKNLDTVLPKGSSGAKTDPGTTAPKAEPPAATEDGGKKNLSEALLAAAGADRDALLTKYRDTVGAEYTDALTEAIPKMTGEAQNQAREALAQRLTRMNATTLNKLMADKDRELRRAAALATAAKGKDRLAEFADSLVRLTNDADKAVVQAARTSLKALSGEDFGPEPGASAADQSQAFMAWREWWAKQKKN